MRHDHTSVRSKRRRAAMADADLHDRHSPQLLLDDASRAPCRSTGRAAIHAE